jgi:predicted phosphodiesterase
MREWTTREVQFLVGSLEKPTKEIYLSYCDEYGEERSYDSVQKKVQALRSQQPSVSDEPTIEQIVQSNDTSDLKMVDVSAALRRERKELAKAWLQGVVDVTDEIKGRLAYHGSRSVVNSNKSSLCVLLSDTHFGKHTKWFDLETARKRMEEIPIRIKQQPLPEIDEVVVILAGDMVEGEDIYPTQNTHVECSAIEQVQACAESIWKTVLTFKELFKCPVRVETCPGNHGRVSRTANEKTNWDNVVYHILRIMASMYNDKSVVVNCNFDPFRNFQVKDKMGLAYHHGVQHTGTASMRVKVAGWMQSKKFDFLVHGHWHEWHVGNWLGKFVIGNGCMCGPDDLAEKMAVEDDARQAYFLVSPGQPVHSFSFVEWPRA